MAEVEAPGSQATQHQQHQRPHGTKRPAEAGLENEQRLSKRFDLLNLRTPRRLCYSGTSLANNAAVDSNGTPCRFYIPVAGSSDTATQSSKPLPRPIAPVTQRKRERRPRPPPADDGMQVEDTPDRVYIHDLAAELSDIESDEENPIFLSDIEKHLAKIPKHVLAAPELKPTRDNQLILYNVPSSLTVPEEQDRVRKAIVEARARIRDKQANPVSEPAATFNGDGALHTSGQGIAQGSLSVMSDPDAMDLDD
jgi:hypothetical protein